MNKVVLLYWFMHGLVCFQIPYMTFLALSTLAFSILFEYKRKVHSRAMANNAEEDPTRPILASAESVHFWCSAILSFVFFLRFLLYTVCVYRVMWLMLSEAFTINESAQKFAFEEESFVSEFPISKNNSRFL